MTAAVLAGLCNARLSSPGWVGLCPVHKDREQSLRIKEGEDGSPLVTCNKGCTLEEILSALGKKHEPGRPAAGSFSQRREQAQNALFDETEIKKALQAIIRTGGVFEIRALEAQLPENKWRSGIVSGYFDNPDDCVKQLKRIVKAKGIYVTMNSVNPALLARRVNRLEYAKPDELTKDHEILVRHWLLIDIDPERPTGVSASDAEKELAHERAQQIYQFLRARLWPEPAIGDSGNGYHLLYFLELPDQDSGLIEKVLSALARYFSDPLCKIDRTVFNAARIVRLYGTKACKGDSTTERPYRMSRLLRVPGHLQPVTKEQLEQLLKELGAEEEPDTSQGDGAALDVKKFIASHGLEVAREDNNYKGGTRWKLKVCPLDDTHTDSAAIFQYPDGTIGFRCHHDSCVGRGWKEVRRLLDPEYAKKQEANASQGSQKAYPGKNDQAHRERQKDNAAPDFVWEPPPPYAQPPLELLPQELRRYIHAGARTFDVDASFFLLPVLASLAAAIGNARSIRLKDDYIEPSVIWTAVIAPTGEGKSPVLKETTTPMRVREGELIRNNKERELSYAHQYAAWEGKKKSERGPPPEKPPLLTCLMDDATIEAVAKRVNDNPRGVLLAKDELSHWFESFDQYHDRAGADVSRWLSIWTGNFFALDRVTGGRSYRIPNPRLSIASCVVPEVFSKLLTRDFFVRGLPGRFIFSLATRNAPRKWSNEAISPELKVAVNDLFAQLFALQPQTNDAGEQSPKLLGLDREAALIFATFYDECARRAFESDLREASQWAKLSGYAARLALVGELAHDPNACDVSGPVMREACALARWFGNEAERIFGLLTETPPQRNRRTLLEFIERRGGRVTVRDVMQSYRRLKNQRDQAESELNALVNGGFGTWEKIYPEGAGRPTRVFRLLPVSTSTQFNDSLGKTPNSVDKGQKNEKADFRASSTQFDDLPSKGPNSVDVDSRGHRKTPAEAAPVPGQSESEETDSRTEPAPATSHTDPQGETMI
jgi:hypothetical protein